MKHDIEDRFFFQLSEEDVPAPPAESRSAREGRRLALIGCFRPRRCGIATFTADSFDHLRSAAPALAIDVYAMRGRPGDADDPDVRLAIDGHDPASYRAAAEAINQSGADAVRSEELRVGQEGASTLRFRWAPHNRKTQVEHKHKQ